MAVQCNSANLQREIEALRCLESKRGSVVLSLHGFAEWHWGALQLIAVRGNTIKYLRHGIVLEDCPTIIFDGRSPQGLLKLRLAVSA